MKILSLIKSFIDSNLTIFAIKNYALCTEKSLLKKSIPTKNVKKLRDCLINVDYNHWLKFLKKVLHINQIIVTFTGIHYTNLPLIKYSLFLLCFFFSPNIKYFLVYLQWIFYVYFSILVLLFCFHSGLKKKSIIMTW